jgi:hypothetical protein
VYFRNELYPEKVPPGVDGVRGARLKQTRGLGCHCGALALPERNAPVFRVRRRCVYLI